MQLFAFVKRKAGMSREDFLDYWRDTHGPLIRDTPGLGDRTLRYEQHAARAAAGLPDTSDAIQFDQVIPPPDAPDTWDVADALESGWTPSDVVFFTQSSHRPVDLSVAWPSRGMDPATSRMTQVAPASGFQEEPLENEDPVMARARSSLSSGPGR